MTAIRNNSRLRVLTISLNTRVTTVRASTSITALGTAAAGASLALGAFPAGLVISESDYGHQAMAELLPWRGMSSWLLGSRIN